MLAKNLGLLLFPPVNEQVAGIVEMSGHQSRWKFGVSIFDGSKDRFVEGNGVLQIDHLRSDNHHVEHRAMNGVKQSPSKPVAGCLKDDPMEKEVGCYELDPVALAILEVRKGLTQKRDVRGVCAFCCFGRQRGFDHETQ